MIRTILILKLLIVLVFQPVMATMLVPASLTDQEKTGDLLTQSRHCPDRATPGCADMEACSAVGYSSCDAQIAALPIMNRFDAVKLPGELATNANNYYLLIPQGPPGRPPRYS
jgi:hypothetical protein